jgi:hypothetical protein
MNGSYRGLSMVALPLAYRSNYFNVNIAVLAWSSGGGDPHDWCMEARRCLRAINDRDGTTRKPELLNDAGRAIGRITDQVVEEVDAGGPYCALARYQHYVSHEFRPFDGDAWSLMQLGALTSGGKAIKTMSTTRWPLNIASLTGRASIPDPQIQFKCASSVRAALGGVT